LFVETNWWQYSIHSFEIRDLIVPFDSVEWEASLKLR